MSTPFSIRPLIRMRGLCKSYPTATGDLDVIKGIDLDIFPGEFVVIAGRSGSGKSTLLNMVTAIDRPTVGSVNVAGETVHEIPERRIGAWRGRTVGIVFQFFQLLPTLSALENVLLPMDFVGVVPARGRQERAMSLLRDLGVEALADKLPQNMSGGEQQRVAIARALANDPPVIAADEPTGNLDSRTSAAVIESLASLSARGKTVLMISHEKGMEAFGARVVEIEDGRILSGCGCAAMREVLP